MQAKGEGLSAAGRFLAGRSTNQSVRGVKHAPSRLRLVCPCLILALAWSIAGTFVGQLAVAAEDLQTQLSDESTSTLLADAGRLGDPQQGALLFYQSTLGCAKCHQLDDGTRSLGPNLAVELRSQADVNLVESLLRPSAVIRPAYQTLTIERTDGRVQTGTLVSETPEVLTLRDASEPTQELQIPTSEIAHRVVQPESLMPAGLASLLANRQQFLDLLKFLQEIREGGPSRAAELRPAELLVAAPLPAYESQVDHRGLIESLIVQQNPESLQRGEAIYQRVCASCHGTIDKVGSLPTSLRFAEGRFKNGSDPYTMYRTLTHGFGLMVAQRWMVPRQKYDVIHYIRETYLKPKNPTQYFAITDTYLGALPVGNTWGPEPSEVEPWTAMDYGQFLTASYEFGDDAGNIAQKGIAVRLDEGTGGVARGRTWLVFEHDTMRVAGAWSGDRFIDWTSILMDGQHGVHPHAVGDLILANPTGPGWANPESQSWSDEVRVEGRDGRRYGPLPRNWAQFRGLYQHGERVVLHYTIGGTSVWESPGMLNWPAEANVPTPTPGPSPVITRSLRLAPHEGPLRMRVAKLTSDELAPVGQDGRVVVGTASLPHAERRLMAGWQGSSADARWSMSADHDLVLEFPASDQTTECVIWSGQPGAGESLDYAARQIGKQLPQLDLDFLMSGSPTRWPEQLTTAKTRAVTSGPFEVDILEHPVQNPWNSRLRITGFDFYPDGDRAAVCAWDGDVWLVSGLLGNDGQLTWRRIASGLFQPLGLKIINDVIHITCRDQLVRLHDLNHDQETDFYECFNSDHQVTEHFHEFAMGLQVDAAGNFYYAKSARHALPAVVPHHGTLLKVTPDGQHTEIVARGFRAANGVCLNPDGTFIVTDQEGHWNPKNRINWVRPGGFYGNMFGYHDVTDSSDQAMEQPLCWITNDFDRSPAELLWVDSPKWGPFQGSLLNLSYGYGRIFLVPHESIDGQMQGGMVQLPIPDAPTGLIRGRFSPVDGQLYVCGMYAWAGSREQPGGMYRIRYTGEPAYLPLQIHAHTEGIDLVFSDSIDGDFARDTDHYHVEVWGLKRSENYGSPHIDQHPLRVASAEVLVDGRTLRLHMPDIRPTWSMEIRYTVQSPAGKRVSGRIHNTIHHLNPPTNSSR